MVKLVDKEKELLEKGEVMEIPSTMPNVETDTTSLFKAMSHVNLRDVELTGLKLQNKNLEDMDLKKEEESKKLEERCQELINQNGKLNKQVISQMALQGA